MIARQDNPPTSGVGPSTGRVTSEVISDDYTRQVGSDAPEGEHAIEVGMVNPISDRRLPILGDPGKPLGDRVLLETVSVRSPWRRLVSVPAHVQIRAVVL